MLFFFFVVVVVVVGRLRVCTARPKILFAQQTLRQRPYVHLSRRRKTTGKTNTSFGDCFGIDQSLRVSLIYAKAIPKADLCQSNPQSSCLFCL